MSSVSANFRPRCVCLLTFRADNEKTRLIRFAPFARFVIYDWCASRFVQSFSARQIRGDPSHCLRLWLIREKWRNAKFANCATHDTWRDTLHDLGWLWWNFFLIFLLRSGRPSSHIKVSSSHCLPYVVDASLLCIFHINCSIEARNERMRRKKESLVG